MIRHMVTLAAVGLSFGVLTAVTALPAVAAGEHCPAQGSCLYSGANYTGTLAVVPSQGGCHTVASLGFSPARSAARGFGDGSVLQLYSDSACQASLGTVTADVPVTAAASYRVVFIPG